MNSKKMPAHLPIISNSNGTRVFAISSLRSTDFTGISIMIIPQMPVGKGLQFISNNKKTDTEKKS
jgi:hypothetical protein